MTTKPELIRSPEPDPWLADRAPWLVVDTDAACFTCRRCGACDPFDVPVVSLWDWVKGGQLFVDKHRKCKAAAAPQGSLL